MKLKKCSLFLLLFGTTQIKALRSYGSFMSNVFHIFTDEYEPPPQDENNKPVVSAWQWLFAQLIDYLHLKFWLIAHYIFQPEMVRNYGYECEVHEYQTEDGYINVLHRIPPRNPNGRYENFKNSQISAKNFEI